jgi:DNA-3-methyladenine glycosylase I
MTNIAQRCPWGDQDDLYRSYHDNEWGYPVVDDHRLFEKICLEGFQAGLSWLTILRKRDRFRQVFLGFDFERVAKFSDTDVDRLLGDAGIIRHAGKINATINNANRAIEMHEEFGSLAAYFWGFEPIPGDRPTDFSWENFKTIGVSVESKALSKDLKKRGWKFVGPTTCYAFMQSMGLVNDHMQDCFCRSRAEAQRKDFVRP